MKSNICVQTHKHPPNGLWWNSDASTRWWIVGNKGASIKKAASSLHHQHWFPVTGLSAVVRRYSDGLTELERFFSHQLIDEEEQREEDTACQCPRHKRKAALNQWKTSALALMCYQISLHRGTRENPITSQRLTKGLWLLLLSACWQAS